MFGYVRPLVSELKVKEHEAFKAVYCGLCKAIKKQYSNPARLMLNYDCTVLSLLLSAMGETPATVSRERCIANPLKKRMVAHCETDAYAAAVNVMLGVGKIRDTAVDDKKAYAAVIAAFYHRADRRAKKNHEALAQAFERHIGALHALEQQGSADIDATAGEFAQLLGAVFELAPLAGAADATRRVLFSFGYNIGRWLYIADALDDLEKDAQKGRYNVFLARGAAPGSAAVLEEAGFNMRYCLSEACKAYELLDIKRDKPLLDNIMYLGLAKTTEDLLKGGNT